jgi:hypothetical protein
VVLGTLPAVILDLEWGGTQTEIMAHIYMSFDFGTDEEKAQLARHKLEMWKQAFRLDKKLLYKFERTGPETVAAAPVAEVKSEKPAKAEKPGKAAKGAKGKAKAEPAPEKKAAAPAGPVKLHLRLGFSGHEKMTEERLLKMIPSEQPFKDALPAVMRQGEPGFDETSAVFDALD